MPSALRTAAPPHSVEAERSLLGALLMDSDRLYDVLPIIAAGDFYDPVLQRVYEAFTRLHEDRRATDYITLANELSSDESLRTIGGSAFLATLAQEVPTASHATHYAQIVREKSQKRALAKMADTLRGLAADDAMPSDQATEQAERMLLGLSRKHSASTSTLLSDAADEAFARYAELHEAEDKQALYGITTGFQRLDRMLTGLSAGQLMVLAARPSMGKTALALDIARHVAKQGKRVLFCSLEMGRSEIMDRIIAGYLGVETWKLKRGELADEDFARMGPMIDGLRESPHPIYIDDDADTTLANLRSKARRHQMQEGLDLLIVDYLQLIEATDKSAGDTRYQQVSYVSRCLKNLARELQAPILALSQLSRACEQRNPAIPILSDLRESGSIEQDADVVAMLYREGYYNEDCESPNATDLYLRKNRSGPTGRVELHFDAAKMSFREIDRRHREGVTK